jgi:hypothetical protein
VVKATVGTLYAGVGHVMEKNTKYQSTDTHIPSDISVHAQVLELIFSLLMVNPSYLLRLYVTFVSDSSRRSRKLMAAMSSNQHQVKAGTERKNKKDKAAEIKVEIVCF